MSFKSPARLGVIVPSSNTSVEIDLPKMLPGDISLHAARLPQIAGVRVQSVHEMADDIRQQARLLATAAVDVILVAATVPTLIHGLDWDMQLVREIEAETGVRTTTASTEMIAALKALGIRRLVLGTPFVTEMNEPIVHFLTASGFEVLASHGMGVSDNVEIGRLEAPTANDVARLIDRPDADTILFVCTNWSILDAVATVESDHGKPVVAVTQACLRGALSLLGRPLQGAGPGRLFAIPPEHAAA